VLAGIRVLDSTRLLPGPYATWLLASMGAEVIKVEQPVRGDYIRHNYPRYAGTSIVFHLYNNGKKSVALNLKHDEGRAAFLDLVVTSDLVFDGNRPGVLDRLGVGYETCLTRNPGVVYCAITGYGQTGPYRDRVGHDANYLSYAGVLSGLADAQGVPVAPRVTIADMAGGLVAVGASLAALLDARDQHLGRFVDVSMMDTALSMSGLRLAEELFAGEARPPDGVAGDGDDYEYGVYETCDGRYISLDPYEMRFKDALWTILEEEGVGTRPDHARSRSGVRDALAAAILQRPLARWDELLADADVCYGPVYAPRDLLTDSHVRARGLVSHEGEEPRLAPPMRFRPEVERRTPRPTPDLGADTAALLEELGWPEARIAAAEKAGAIHRRR
jgi:alpha-methylacyl-CoA racemase